MALPGITAVGAAALLALTACSAEPEPSAAPPPAATTAAAPVTTTNSPSPTASPTTSPTPTMTRKQACTQAAEGAVDWVHLVARFSADPSGDSTDATEFQDLSTKISETLTDLPRKTRVAAKKLIDPLDAIYGVLVTGENTTIELEDARDAVPDAMSCASKNSLKGYQSDWES